MKLVYSICLCFSLIFLPAGNISAQTLTDTTTLQQLEIISSVYNKVLSEYPNDIEPEKFLHTGINEMLKTLDPFTTFLSKSEVQEFQMNMSAKFGGIGMVIGESPEGIILIEVFQGKPADRAGLRAADIILEINGLTTKEKNIDEVLPLLRGTPGTVINISVKHAGEMKTSSYKIEREVINISPVPYYGMLNESIAYIRLTRESENCSQVVKDALKDLYDKYNFKGLVFDLRSNEGGYFKEAVKIANMFIDKGELLVSVRGKDKDTLRYAEDDAIYPSTPLVLLTDNYTVSSGEILAGAIQDNDRAVIIGQKTFGKGLVQEVFDMPQGTQLKLTTSYYYTPSGRCIQAFEYTEGNQIQIADSLKKVFKTKNGRTVYSSGGVTPDIITEYQEPAAIIQNLLNDLLIFDFATQYKLSHTPIAPAKNFYITDEDYSAFVEFVKSKNFNHPTETENKLAALKETAEKEGCWQSIQNSYLQIEKDMSINKEKELLNNKKLIKHELEKEILSRYYGQAGRYEADLRNDIEVKKGIEILSDTIIYNRLLNREIK